MEDQREENSAGGMVLRRSTGQLEWLIVQNASHMGWGFPKGIIGDKIQDETPQQAALREVREEGGITAAIIDPSPIITTYSFRSNDTLVHKKVNYFLMEYIDGNISQHDEEVCDIRFVDEQTVLATLTYEEDKQAFAQMLRTFASTLPIR